MYKLTTATKKVQALKKRIRAVQGGTSASKTISILLDLINLAQRDTVPTLTSVVSESIPHLKRWALRDFKNIMIAHQYFQDARWNSTDSVYTFETWSKLEFFSTDNGDKLRGARRDRLFMNECNNIHVDAFDQLEVRTKEFIFLDWNPSNDFWFYEQVQHREDCEHIILTYLDNEALPIEIKQAIEAKKGNARWWKVYGEGLLGDVDGKIYKDWITIDEMPHEARLEVRGMDFGYSNDPSTIIDIYKYNGGYILDEQLYRKWMSNKQIADFIHNLERPETLIIADSAEPKSIDEIRSYWVTILPAVKWPDSIRNWIQVIQDMKISMTKRSTNLIKEYRNYLWKIDRDWKVLNVPEWGLDHLLDWLRYWIVGITKRTTNFDYEAFEKRELLGRDNIYNDIWI